MGAGGGASPAAVLQMPLRRSPHHPGRDVATLGVSVMQTRGLGLGLCPSLSMADNYGEGNRQVDRQLLWDEDLRFHFPGPHTATKGSTMVEEEENTMEKRSV